MTDHPGCLETETAEYLPFGLTRKQTSTEVTYYKFTDQEYDAETGLYNYNARLYDPVVGTFISPDSIFPKVYDPQSLNRFAYARNNPLKYNDPDGHAFVLAVPLGIAAFEFAASTTLGITIGVVVGGWLSDVLSPSNDTTVPGLEAKKISSKEKRAKDTRAEG